MGMGPECGVPSRAARQKGTKDQAARCRRQARACEDDAVLQTVYTLPPEGFVPTYLKVFLWPLLARGKYRTSPFLGSRSATGQATGQADLAQWLAQWRRPLF